MAQRFILHRRAMLASLAIVASPVLAPRAHAGQRWDSAWSRGTHSSMRLIAAGASADDAGIYRAGVEIELAPKFKTYWRDPGDSGVPPMFDWSRSRNVGRVEVLWPAPQRHVVDGDATNGYLGEVIFPLRVVPINAAEPAILDLALDYAVCETLCIPAQGKAALALTASGPGPHHTRLQRMESRVPRLVSSTGGSGTLAFRAIALSADTTGLNIDVVAPGDDCELFVEASSGDIGLPKRVSQEATTTSDGRAARLHRFNAAISRRQGKLPEGVRVTASANGRAIEMSVALDAGATAR